MTDQQRLPSILIHVWPTKATTAPEAIRNKHVSPLWSEQRGWTLKPKPNPESGRFARDPAVLSRLWRPPRQDQHKRRVRNPPARHCGASAGTSPIPACNRLSSPGWRRGGARCSRSPNCLYSFLWFAGECILLISSVSHSLCSVFSFKDYTTAERFRPALWAWVPKERNNRESSQIIDDLDVGISGKS